MQSEGISSGLICDAGDEKVIFLRGLPGPDPSNRLETLTAQQQGTPSGLGCVSTSPQSKDTVQ